MIWFTLALAVVSFIAIALLAPKPELEDARKQDLDPNTFPRATLDDPCPLLVGCARLEAPNTLWYGDFEAKAQKEKVKTGLFSSENITTGYKYYLGMDLGLVLGPAVLKGIYIDSVKVDGIDQEIFTYSPTPPIPPQNYPLYLSGYEPAVKDIAPIPLLGSGITESDIATGIITFESTITDFGFWVGEPGGNPVAGSFWVDVYFYDINDEPLAFDYGDEHSIYYKHFEASFSGGPASLHISATVPKDAYYVRIRGIANPYLRFWITVNPGYSVGPMSFDKVILGVQAESFDIYEPELFGGEDEGGGWIGNINWYPGDFEQGADPYINSYGKFIEDVDGEGGDVYYFDHGYPTYRGLAHIVFEKNFIGESPNLHKMEFELAVYTNYLERAYNGALNLDSVDSCLAEAAYMLLHDEWKGLGIPAEKIAFDSFYSAAEILEGERNGGSMLVTSVKTGKALLEEILRQIDGVLRQTEEGQIELFLIRDNYDDATLPVFDMDDIIKVRNYSRSTWEEVVSEVRVSFATRDTDSDAVALATDQSISAMLGRRRQKSVTYPLCYDSDLAMDLAARDLSRLSVPLFAMDLEMNRNAFGLKPGQPIKITIPELNLTEVIVRVKKIDLGQLASNRIIVTLVQDEFAARDVLMKVQDGTKWEPVNTDPVAITEQQITMTPFYFSARTGPYDLFGDPTDYSALVDYNYTGFTTFVTQPQASSSSFKMWADLDDLNQNYEHIADALYPSTGTLTETYSKTAGFVTGVDATGFTLDNVSGDFTTENSLEAIRNGSAGILYSGGEWMAYEDAVDNEDGSWTFTNIHRGLFYSVPTDHAANARVYLMDTDLVGKGEMRELLNADHDDPDQTVYFKLLDRVGGKTYDAELVDTDSYILNNRTFNPYRPRNLQVDAARDLNALYLEGASVTVTWDGQSIFGDLIGLEMDGDGEDTAVAITTTYNLKAYSNDDLVTPFVNLTGLTTKSQVVDTTGINGDVVLIEIETVATVGGNSYTSHNPAWISFQVENNIVELGDGSSGDFLLLSGDAQETGNDRLKVSI